MRWLESAIRHMPIGRDIGIRVPVSSVFLFLSPLFSCPFSSSMSSLSEFFIHSYPFFLVFFFPFFPASTPNSYSLQNSSLLLLYPHPFLPPFPSRSTPLSSLPCGPLYPYPLPPVLTNSLLFPYLLFPSLRPSPSPRRPSISYTIQWFRMSIVPLYLWDAVVPTAPVGGWYAWGILFFFLELRDDDGEGGEERGFGGLGDGGRKGGGRWHGKILRMGLIGNKEKK